MDKVKRIDLKIVADGRPQFGAWFWRIAIDGDDNYAMGHADSYLAALDSAHPYLLSLRGETERTKALA